MKRLLSGATLGVAFVSLFATVLAPVSASAQNLPLTQDSYFASGSSVNYGPVATVAVGGPSSYQGLVQFDLTTLPAGTTGSHVSKATLLLFVNKLGASGQMNVSLANSGWTETGVNGTNNPFPGTLVASSVPVAAAGVYVVVDVTTAVQSWVDNIAANNGLILTAAGGLNVLFDSKESQTTSHPAQLQITLLGPAGPVGATGATGAPGSNGSQGVVGPTGTQGPQGVVGPTGTQGPQGVVGPTGTQGPQGVVGPTGSQGTPGTQGPQGFQGAQGAKGNTGATGPNGATGSQGPKGATGANGTNGTNGADGAQGPAGPAYGDQWVNTSINLPGGTSVAFIASCQPGNIALSGSCGYFPQDAGDFAMKVVYTGPDTNHGSWRCVVVNSDTIPHLLTVGAFCVTPGSGGSLSAPRQALSVSQTKLHTIDPHIEPESPTQLVPKGASSTGFIRP